MKTITLILTALFLISSAQAGNNKKNGWKKAYKKEIAEKEAERERRKTAREMKRNAIQDYLEPRDKNHDGSLTMDEFIADEGDKDSAKSEFEAANKNGDRYLTKVEISAMLELDKKVEEMMKAKQKKKKK